MSADTENLSVTIGCTGCKPGKVRDDCTRHAVGYHVIQCLRCSTKYNAMPATGDIHPRPGITIVDVMNKCYACDPSRLSLSRVLPPFVTCADEVKKSG